MCWFQEEGKCEYAVVREEDSVKNRSMTDSWEKERHRDRRVNEVVKTGRLDTRRIVLSKDHELREALQVIRTEFRKFKSEHPAAVSLHFYGSHMKGYADSNSDFDLRISIDPRLATSPEGSDWGILASGLKKRLVSLLSNERITVSPFLLNRSQISLDTNTASIFMPSADSTAIRPYRRQVIDELEAMGDAGEKKWDDIIDFLWDVEAGRLPPEVKNKRRSLYPWNLKDARAFFLSENKKD